MRILVHAGGWPSNIGNAFIQLSALALVRRADRSAQVIPASTMPRYFAQYWSYAQTTCRPRLLEMAAIADYDVFVVVGMCLCAEFVEIGGPALLEAAGQGKRIIFLGAGAERYDREEKAVVSGFLRRLKPDAMCFRDSVTASEYGQFGRSAFDGIDCAFFLPWAYSPVPLLMEPFRVLTFHLPYSPLPPCPGLQTVYAWHSTQWQIELKPEYESEVLLSDQPEDYLNLYANAQEVHTDRVHAAVATLCFGRRVRFYGATPRAHLFASAGAASVYDRLTELDDDHVALKRAEQLAWLSGVLAL